MRYGWGIFSTRPLESASFGLEGLMYNTVGQGGAGLWRLRQPVYAGLVAELTNSSYVGVEIS